MKASIVVLGFVFVASGAFAQERVQKKSNYPYWTISKDIQRAQYKDIVRESATITTGDVSMFGSKGINKINARPSRKELVSMKGMPSHVISKGVARMQYEKTNRGASSLH
jgi:hypothetical protein